MTPASDLCGLCQLNNAKITKNVNVTEQEKLSCLRDQETHLHEAKTEREFMKTNIAACKEVLQGSDIDLLTGRPSCSFKGTVHYSYDYAQSSATWSYILQTTMEMWFALNMFQR